jgi:hypothetical protein
VRLGTVDAATGRRSFALDSFVFEPSQKQWARGEAVPAGEYSV